MIRDCTTCAHRERDCRIACIEGGVRVMWTPRTEFDTITDAALYVDEIGYRGDYGATRRPDGRYDLRLEGIT